MCIRDRVVEEARRNAEVWDRIEPVCKKAARADKEQLPLIITFVEDCARYAATDKPEGTKFIWMKCAAGKYVAPVSRKALLLEEIARIFLQNMQRFFTFKPIYVALRPSNTLVLQDLLSACLRHASQHATECAEK